MSISLSLDSASLPYIVGGALIGLLAGILFRFVSPEFRSGARRPAPIGGLVGLGAFCGVWVSWAKLLASALASDDPLASMARVPWPFLFLLPGAATGALVARRIAASRSDVAGSRESRESVRRRWGAMGVFVGSVLAALAGGLVWFVLNLTVMWDADRLPERVDARLSEGRGPAGRERAQAAPGRSAPPLHKAAFRGEARDVERLLKHGAEVNGVAAEGRAALHYAANAAVTQQLIAGGADVEASDRHGWTPLHLAARYGKAEVAEALIAAGAALGPHDHYGKPPLHYAASAEVAEVLVRGGADLRAKDGHGNTALHAAAVNGHAAVAEALLALGADIDAKGANGTTPLHQACNAQHPEVVELLLAAGADPNAKDARGMTPHLPPQTRSAGSR